MTGRDKPAGLSRRRLLTGAGTAGAGLAAGRAQRALRAWRVK